MNLDSVILSAVTAELRASLTDGRVEKIYQPGPLDLVFTIRRGGENLSLLFSAEARSPRLHLTSVRRTNPQTPPNFCMLLRKYLEGARLSEIRQIDFDRIVHFAFTAYDGERLTMVVEIMGKHSNIILVNDTNRILGAIKPVGRSRNRYREILPGRDYVPPPSQGKRNPLQVSGEELAVLMREAFGEEEIDPAAAALWLTRTFTGVSPFAARELSMRSGGVAERLVKEFLEFFRGVRQNEFMPVLITDDSGRTAAYYVFPSVQYPVGNQHDRSSANSLVDLYYTSVIPKQEFEEARADLVSRVGIELNARERALETIRRAVLEGREAERLKQIGELILSQISSLREGEASAELVDYYSPTGETVRVEIDPQKTPAENAEAYFSKYHKALSGAAAMEDRRQEVEREAALLRKIAVSADAITSSDQVKELTRLLREHGISIARQDGAQGEKKRAEFDGRRISRVESAGWEILVGQNSEANDYLLIRVAKPSDFWFHVKASPSAHVVIRTNGKPESVPRAVLQEAAEITARHSDQKHSSLVPVDYTLRKHVRRQKGGAPGKALYTHEKTLYITPT